MRLSILLFVLYSLSTTPLFSQNMDNKRLEKIFVTMSDTIEGENGRWTFLIREMTMLCLTDEHNNRMRIISPVAELNKVSEKEILEAMEANFHSALDVKYSISDEIVWVAFIHPLKELSEEQVIDALKQVYSAVLTFGTTYSSTPLAFPKKEEPSKNKDKSGKS